MSFNELTDPQIEALSLLAEEAAEVIQCVTKILLHGLYSHDPTDPDPRHNQEDLTKELGDMEAAKMLCQKYSGVLHNGVIRVYRDHKLRNLPKWLHHATVDGLIETPKPTPRQRAPGEMTEEDKRKAELLQKMKGGFGS